MSYGPRQLADDLKLLQGMRIEAKPDLKAWYEEARKVQGRIRQVPELPNSVPEAVWHFLTDADAWSKDAHYRMSQERQISAIIKQLETDDALL